MALLEASTSSYIASPVKSLPDVDVPILCLCSKNPEDVSWAKKFKHYMTQSGFKDIISTDDLNYGSQQMKVIQCWLKSSKVLIVVLSSSSTGNDMFMNMVQCSVIFVLNGNSKCRIIPVLLSENTELPFMLLNREPFNAWRDDIGRLVKSLFTPEEHLRSYIHNIVQIFHKGHYLHHLSQCMLPPDVSKYVQELGLSVLQWWGLEIQEKRLIVNMNKLQTVGSSQKILLNDLFSGLLLSKIVRFIRVTGFSNFDYEKFRCQEDLFDDLVNLYISIFEIVSRNKFWYNYRRHGVNHTTNLAIYPVSKAVTYVNIKNGHSPEFSSVESRVQSLLNFPLENEEFRVKLAQAGFFYFGYFDYVQCFLCGGCLRTWGLNRDPIVRHATLFPHCPHVQALLTGNNSASNSELDDSRKISHVEPKRENYTNTAICLPQQDYNVDFTDSEKRLRKLKEFKKTFGRFDIKDSVLEQYAKAGFYHYGLKEDILCFSCNLGLSEISTHENPWSVHFNLSPNCPHLNRFKDTPRCPSEKSSEILLESYMEYEIISREIN